MDWGQKSKLLIFNPFQRRIHLIYQKAIAIYEHIQSGSKTFSFQILIKK
jgi:hypothetical protein